MLLCSAIILAYNYFRVIVSLANYDHGSAAYVTEFESVVHARV